MKFELFVDCMPAAEMPQIEKVALVKEKYRVVHEYICTVVYLLSSIIV